MRKFTHTVLTIALLAMTTFVFAGGQQEAGADKAKEAKLVYVNWEEGVAYTHLVKAILEDEMGYDVTITAADVGPAYASVAAGDYDAFMEAWLPGLHATYMAELGDDLVDLAVIYEGAESGLVVPQYMADDGVTAVSDLRDPEVFDKLDGKITGIDAGAGVMITTGEKAMPAYGLDEMGYELVTSSGPAMMAALDTAVVNNEYIVVTGWQPHSMFGYYDLVLLDHDEEQIWGTDDIHIIGRVGLKDEKPELAQFFDNMELSTSEVGSLIVAISESNLSTLEAAREWKDANRDVWGDWVPAN